MQSPESYEEIILNSNKAAIQLLKNQEFDLAKPYLDTSVNILSSKKVKNARRLFPITLNNYGCYYKRLGKFPEALEYFDSALEMSQGKGLNVTETYLNISNVFLQSGRYSDALQAGYKALRSLKTSRKYSKTAVLVYQALGNLYKLMGMVQESQQMYLKGLITSQRVLGNANKLTKDLESVYDSQRKSKSPENFVRANRRNTRFQNFTPDLKPRTNFIHDYIPTPVDHMQVSTAKALNSYEPKVKSIAPSLKTLKFTKKIRNFSENRLKKYKTIKYKPNKLKETLIPVPKRGFSLSNPKFSHYPTNIINNY